MPKKKDNAAPPSETEDASPHSFWSGTITFGLVSIPIDLIPATGAGESVPLRMLSEDGAALRREYVCPREDAPIPPEELGRGFPLADGSFVLVTDEELESLAPEKSRDIELSQFVDRHSIDPMLFRRAYYLAPRGDSTRAYRLLADAMERGNRAGIATFVMREKEHPIAIFADGGILRAQTLRFADELRTPAQVGLPAAKEPSAADVKQFSHIIEKDSKDGVPAAALHDAAAHELRALADAKHARGEGVIESPIEHEKAAPAATDAVKVLKHRLSHHRSN